MLLRSLCARLSVCVLVGSTWGAIPSLQAVEKAAAVREPAEIVVEPAKLELVGPDAVWTLLVDRRLGDGRLVDAGEEAEFTSGDERVCRVSPTGEVQAVADGKTTVTVAVDGRKIAVPVAVARSTDVRKLHFENDVTPLLTRFACNYSGCHGKAEGQNGFKLSVFGFDPRADYDALTKEGRGRRLAPAAPDESLFLQKAAGVVPHGGGPRIELGSREYALLRSWIATGMPLGEPDAPHVVAVALSPRERLLPPRVKQRLRAVARYSDGREVDVTSLAKFQTNNDAIAAVDETGLVRIGEVPGQVAVMASFAGQVDVFTALIPQTESLPTPNPTDGDNFIDRLVNAKLNRLNIGISERCDDAEFLRRATLDVVGTLPTADEARAFLADQSSDKRERWVAALLDRPEFADYWALKWADLLRVERQALGHKAARDYYEWIRGSFAENKPLDQFARELLTADGPLAERPEGAFYRVVTKPGETAGTVSQVFLGVRIACAECHHHPHDRWSQADYQGMASHFMQVGVKKAATGDAITISGEPVAKHPRTGEPIAAHPLGTPQPESSPTGDRRRALAEWMTSPENPWFARNIANRAWAHFLGRGLVEPVDDVRATNPPSNPELLDALARSVIESGYDFRQLIRTITASAAYQRTSTPIASNARDEQNYSRALFKRMEAEVLLDAVCQTTGVAEKFPGVPAGSRAVQLWDSRVSHYFLKLFGRPIRTTACTCERSVEANVGQVLHLLNSPELNAKLKHRGGRLAKLVEEQSQTPALVDELYLTFLTRYPTEAERSASVQYLDRPGTDRREATQDLGWSLLNTLEFMFNH